MHPSLSPTSSFEDLVYIIRVLRKECPWDKKQTHESIKDLMVEELYEALDAIDAKDYEELKKELGDLLLHIVFHSVMGEETNAFTMKDVIFSIQEKLIRRHPHVFEHTKVSGADEVLKNWESIKLKEQGRKRVLEGVPSQLPSLLRAQRMQEKAAGVGFDWDTAEECFDKVKEELGEFEHDLKRQDHDAMTKEFGDLLFALVNVGRKMNISSEDALRMTNNKFQTRFEFVEDQVSKSKRPFSDFTLKELDTFWDQAKIEEQT